MMTSSPHDGHIAVPFLDLRASYLELKAAIDGAIAKVLQSGCYILGAEVEAFEAEFASYVGAASCVGVGNGFDALCLSLRALDIGPGDEVIVPSNTYIATWLAVSAVGATIVPVEPDSTFCLDPSVVQAAITRRTKALIAVHLYGQPADLFALRQICRENAIRMIEDAAQAHGASLAGARIGASPDLVAWSFYPSKNLGAFGDAGAVTTDDGGLARRLATLRNYGSPAKNYNTEKGANSRLDPLQAAILRVKLGRLDAWNGRRAAIAARYAAALSHLPLELPSARPSAMHCWHLYVVCLEDRDELRRFLADRGITTAIHYPIPPFAQAAYRDLGLTADRYPRAARIASRALSLPIGPHMSDRQVDQVIDGIVSWATRRRGAHAPAA